MYPVKRNKKTPQSTLSIPHIAKIGCHDSFTTPFACVQSAYKTPDSPRSSPSSLRLSSVETLAFIYVYTPPTMSTFIMVRLKTPVQYNMSDETEHMPAFPH
jgi:hypothetical protein